MDRILFVDDDKFFGTPYVENLRASFADRAVVDVCTKIDDAIHYFHAHPDLKVIVLDVMMPPPQTAAYRTEDVVHATEDGFATGVWYLRLLKGKLVDQQTRVFVLTNRNYDEVQAMVAAIGFPPGLVECERKLSVPAASLPNRVVALINRPLE